MNTRTPLDFFPPDPSSEPAPIPKAIAAVKKVAMIRGRSARKRRSARALKPKLTSYFQGSSEFRKSVDMERTLRASAYLLDRASGFGNEPLDPCIALGVAKILDLCAQGIKEDREHGERRIR